jgi:hypothetical protein
MESTMNQNTMRKYIRYALVLADGTVLQEGLDRAPVEALADRMPGTHIERRTYRIPHRGRGTVGRRNVA